AQRVVADFHSAEAAAKTAEVWTKQHQKREVPEDVEKVAIQITGDRVRLDKLVERAGLADSVSDALRKVRQGAVRVNGEVKTDPLSFLNTNEELVLQVGRKIKRVRVSLAVEIKSE